ncbi:MAG: gliding motility-associated C-terminal domain-containing protein [Bacteroidales bacterium]|nr:gliding motility-associated C-terminal domain-containing protein [Bacteroidales bacterium]
MKKKCIMTMVVLMSAMLTTAVMAQSSWNQQQACPGWNNPANFTSGGVDINRYAGSGVTVTSSKPCPNPTMNVTNRNQLMQCLGVNDMPTTYTASQLNSVQSSGGCYGGTSLPNYLRQFLIVTDTLGHDPNTGNRLPYVPRQYNTRDTTPGVINTHITKSIRIGDGCSNGSGSDAFSGAELNYTMRVSTDNAMLYIYYAIVAESPTHGQQGNPTFIIRVCKKTSTGLWKQINDTLCYFIASTPASGGTSNSCAGLGYVNTETSYNSNGWHANGSSILYKDWDKVAINLSNYIYDTVQISVMIYDCLYNAHFAYAYIAGECRPMIIQASGCPPGISTDVGTLTAPSHMRNYVWYASEWGVAEPATSFGPGQRNGHFTWRQLTADTSTQNVYHVQAQDFKVTRRFNEVGTTQIVDSVGNWQTFRCRMTSALNPAKPFTSDLYVNMQNKKPSMAIDSLYTCDGGAKLWNNSKVPGDPSLTDISATQWFFYSNANAGGTAIDTLVGDSITRYFADTDIKSVRVRTFTTDPTCYTDGIYPFQPRLNPKAGMTISPKVLCDDDAATITDTTSGNNNSRIWRFRSEDADEDDMTLNRVITGTGQTNKQITSSFTHGVEPIELTVRNGMFYYDPVRATDTLWCETTVRDTVTVFSHPTLLKSGDWVVCEGERTNLTVSAAGVENCTYEWSTRYGTVAGGLPAGPTLRVVPYADTCTYYVKVTSPQGCVAWDSVQTYLVRPKLAMIPEDGRICPGQTATLVGTEADHYSWTASPADASLAGQENAATINVTPSATTVYTMVGHGSNNCDATPLRKTVTIVPLPVPNVKTTPGFIDTDDPTVVLRDQSAHSVASTWQFPDGTEASGREVSHHFENCEGFESVPVVLTSYNSLGCTTEHRFSIPVRIFTAWFPNAFTPGSSDGNHIFSLFTTNEYEFFQIYIYNRRGEKVFESDDVDFQWDGTHDGEPCQQGAYVYTVRFRKPGTTTLESMHGVVTLLR